MRLQAMAARPLRAVPDTQELETELFAMADTIVGLEATVRKQAREIGALKRDEEAKAEADPLWPLALRVFEYQSKASGHQQEWTVERFKQAKKLKRRRTQQEWLRDLLRAVSGNLSDVWMVEHGQTTWESVFESQKKYERALAACPVSWSPPAGAEALL
jgi:hypothetical protein